MKNKFYRSNIPPRSALNLKIKNLNENANNTYKGKNFKNDNLYLLL